MKNQFGGDSGVDADFNDEPCSCDGITHIVNGTESCEICGKSWTYSKTEYFKDNEA